MVSIFPARHPLRPFLAKAASTPLPVRASKYDLRPLKSASVDRVPYSDSNRSSNGVRARMLRMACTKPMWMKGYVLMRWNPDHLLVSKVIPRFLVGYESKITYRLRY